VAVLTFISWSRVVDWSAMRESFKFRK